MIYERYPNGHAYIAGRRTHHGLIGVLLAAIGLGLALDDRGDWRCWVPDLWRDRR